MTYDSCSCDYEPAEFYSERRTKARKVHRCDECSGSINPGETYRQSSGKWAGDFMTYKMCPLCMELEQWARISVPCFCYTFSELHEHVRNMVDEVAHDCPAGFTMEWGRRIIKIERHASGQHWPRKHERNKPWRTAAEIAASSNPRL